MAIKVIKICDLCKAEYLPPDDLTHISCDAQYFKFNKIRVDIQDIKYGDTDAYHSERIWCDECSKAFYATWNTFTQERLNKNEPQVLGTYDPPR